MLIELAFHDCSAAFRVQTYLEGRLNESKGGKAVGGTRTKASGTAEALVNVLNARRSPLSFRVQPLVLHLNALDDFDHTNSWTGGHEPAMFLVAKREVLAAVDEGPSAGASESLVAETHGKPGKPTKSLPVAAAGVGLKGGHKGSHNTAAMRVVEEEELGRIGPFTVHSATTVLSDSSLTVPSSALVADVQRRSGSGAGRSGGGSSHEPAGNIVLEIIRSTAAGGGQNRPFLKKHKKHTRESASEKGPGDGGRVVARAVLEADFLRRTIGCQRSVLMTIVPAGIEGVDAPDQNVGNAGLAASQGFARLDVAGHAVSSRPGRPQLRLQVLECQNLKSADVLGKSDPCVLVLWDGVEVGRTPIARDELHPVFSASGATFRLPLVPPSTKRAGIGAPSSASLKSLDWKAYAPELRLEVWDMDRDVFSRKWKKGQMLGSVTLQGPRSIAPVVEASTEQCAKASTTGPVKRLAPGVIVRLDAIDRRVSSLGEARGKPEQASVGVVSIKVAVENDTDASEAWMSQANTKATNARGSNSSGTATLAPGASPSVRSPVGSPENNVDVRGRLRGGLGIWCLDARGLPVGCDGYCRVFWNGIQVGRTPPASQVSQGLRDKLFSGKHNSAPVSAFERNPVWWMSLIRAEPCDGRGDEQSGATRSNATAVVSLRDNPDVEDQLTLEVFDGSHMHDTNHSSIASSGGSLAGKGTADARRNNDAVGKGSDTSNAVRRDVLGRLLGSTTIRGEYLVRPPGDRIDLPLNLSTPSSNKDSSAAGRTLSVTLARLRMGEQPADSTLSCTHPPQREVAPEEEQHRCNKTDSTAPTATSTAVSAESNGCQAKENLNQQRPARWLRLLIEGARLSRGLDISGTSDPFCVVYVDRVWHSETRVCWGTLAPRWDQLIQIEVFGRAGAPAMGLGLAGHEIRIEVWDKDLVGANDFIGEVHLHLHENLDG